MHKHCVIRWWFLHYQFLSTDKWFDLSVFGILSSSHAANFPLVSSSSHTSVASQKPSVPFFEWFFWLVFPHRTHSHQQSDTENGLSNPCLGTLSIYWQSDLKCWRYFWNKSRPSIIQHTIAHSSRKNDEQNEKEERRWRKKWAVILSYAQDFLFMNLNRSELWITTYTVECNGGN